MDQSLGIQKQSPLIKRIAVYENWKGKKKMIDTLEGVDKLRGDGIDTIRVIFSYLIPESKRVGSRCNGPELLELLEGLFDQGADSTPLTEYSLLGSGISLEGR